MPVRTDSAAQGFRLGGRVRRLDDTICLYRAIDGEAMAASRLVLTRDRRFAWINRAIGRTDLREAEEWSAERARRFLLDHGEGDIVEEFPDIFRASAGAAPAKKRAANAPRNRPTEPYLFPLH